MNEDVSGIVWPLVALVDEYEDAVARGLEHRSGDASSTVLELIDLDVRIVRECERLIDVFRTDLAENEDALHLPGSS
ncbi:MULTISPECIES: hypothetical protein [unclassified Amycolatopsis]|uniref:hypothetical protein n=1 Tax=unclassified Amycolatopsis TaxID=2618356 RepID=UPI00106E34B7|nr:MULTISPECIES: hypothetical protein [unclassified Amycolatopsis]